MTTTRPRTAGTGVVSIHSNSPLADILHDAQDSTASNGKTRKKSRGQLQRSKSAGAVESDTRRVNIDYVQFDYKGWLSKNSAKKIQEKTDFESSSVRNVYNTLLENETCLAEDIDDFLDENEELCRRKKFLLFRDWNDKVYSPLKAEIDKEMNSRSYQRLERAKRDLYREYLRYTNRKGNVYLDTISYDGYDPLSISGHRPGPLKVTVKKPKDPLLMQAEKRNDEDRIVIHCETGLKLTDREIEKFRLPPLPLVPLGRRGTECGDFLAMELYDIESDVRRRSQQRFLGVRTKSELDFEKWNRISNEPGLIDREIQIQKKRQYPERNQTTILLT